MSSRWGSAMYRKIFMGPTAVPPRRECLIDCVSPRAKPRRSPVKPRADPPRTTVNPFHWDIATGKSARKWGIWILDRPTSLAVEPEKGRTKGAPPQPHSLKTTFAFFIYQDSTAWPLPAARWPLRFHSRAPGCYGSGGNHSSLWHMRGKLFYLCQKYSAKEPATTFSISKRTRKKYLYLSTSSVIKYPVVILTLSSILNNATVSAFNGRRRIPLEWCWIRECDSEWSATTWSCGPLTGSWEYAMPGNTMRRHRGIE